MVSIDPLEALYLIVNFSALVLTMSALLDARADSAAVKLLNGKARELAAGGNVRREFGRILVLLLLLSIVVPGIDDPDPIPLSPFVLALLAIPFILLASTIADARDRRAMTALVTADLLAVGTDRLQRIEDKLDANTKVTQEAREHADAAYKEANSVNEKIRVQGEALVIHGETLSRQGEVAAESAAEVIRTGERIEDVVDDTKIRVTDIQERLA